MSLHLAAVPEPTTTSPTADAFAALIAALKAEAVSGDFERTTGFLHRIQNLEARWTSGQTAHTPRTTKAG